MLGRVTNNGNNDDAEAAPHWDFSANTPASTTNQGELKGGMELRGGAKVGT